ncbi:transcription elongation factor GreA [Porphyromonas sp.]|uniref:transcription elongation factor GreA n=1 Tax=Porphyromonas sp. TaxID=1924944 RepID=UPI0026DC1610|nr:transcription elongation factor GreA [Porphyromonas sp.]MDO4770643.1 transcription elongation factor GreA [Porphyromonas sp.]
MEYIYMTEEGYNKLLEEVKKLETVDRPEVIRAIAEARDKGDLSENAEYSAAKEAQGLLEARIAGIRSQLVNVRIIDTSNLSTDTVQMLNKVTIKNLATGKSMTYTIVSDTESDLKAGKIAISTPIAKGLVGKKVGDVAEIEVPNGKVTFEIEEISF